MITKIQAENIKGQTFNHAITPTTVFTGDNFTGKTARFDAIILALCGKLPALGARSKDTFDLSSGLRLSTSVEFSSGDKITRNFWTDKGTVKADCVSSFPEDKLEKLRQSPLFNTSRYFELSDNEKVRFVFENCRVQSAITAVAIMVRLKKVKLEAINEQTEEAMSEFLDMVKDNLSGSVISGITKLSNKEDGILTEQFTALSRRTKDTEGTVRVLTELKLRESEASAENIVFLDGQIDEAEKQLGMLRENYGAMKQRNSKAKETKSKIDRLEAIVRQPRPKYEIEIVQLEEKADTLKSVIIDSPSPSQSKAQDLYSVCSEAHIKVLAAKKSTDDAKTELEKLAKMVCCPFCKSVGDEWKDKLKSYFTKIANKSADEHKENSAYYTLKKTEYESVNQAYTESLAVYLVSQSARQPLSNVERDIRLLQDARDKFDASVIEAKESLVGLCADNGITTEVIEAQELAGKTAAEKAAELRRKRDTAKDLALDIARASQASLEHDIAVAKLSVLKAIGKELKIIQQDIVDEAFNSMLEVANMVAGDVLRSPLAYHDGEIGRWQGSRFVSHKTFSGTETAICHIAIATALSAEFPMKIVLIDELARLDEKSTDKLMSNMALCVQNKILEQVLVIDLRNKPRKGWQVIAL